MLQLILNIAFVLVALSLIALVLMQRGAGAQAGSGFGGGASATVFGSRGASNFLSKSTKWLAIVFFTLTLFMAWQATKVAHQVGPSAVDLGVMSEIPSAPAAPGEVPAAPGTAPAAPGSSVPAAPEAQSPAAPSPAQGETGQEVPQGG